MATEKEMLVTPGINTLGRNIVKSQDQEDYETVVEWKETVATAIQSWWDKVDDVNKAAYSEAYKMTPLGYCVLDIPIELGYQLANQYGWEAFQDKDFIKFAQKAFGQTFMPSV
jgi:hypothetical protein